jgi:hypothetical protein
LPNFWENGDGGAKIIRQMRNCWLRFNRSSRLSCQALLA